MFTVWGELAEPKNEAVIINVISIKYDLRSGTGYGTSKKS